MLFPSKITWLGKQALFHWHLPSNLTLDCILSFSKKGSKQERIVRQSVLFVSSIMSVGGVQVYYERLMWANIEPVHCIHLCQYCLSYSVSLRERSVIIPAWINIRPENYGQTLVENTAANQCSDKTQNIGTTTSSALSLLKKDLSI